MRMRSAFSGLSRGIQAAAVNLDLPAVGMAAEGQVNIPAFDMVPPVFRVVAEEQAVTFLLLKAVQKGRVRRSLRTGQSADADASKGGTAVVQ